MPTSPEEGFAVAASVRKILAEKGTERRARAIETRRGRGPRHARTRAAQGQVEYQVFAIIQPLRIAADGFPRGSGEQHRPARWEKALWPDLARRGQRGRSECELER